MSTEHIKDLGRLLADEDEPFLSAEESVRVTYEVIANAGSEGIEREEILKAADKLEDWAITAALVELWRRQQIVLGWSVDDQELWMRATTAADNRTAWKALMPDTTSIEPQ